MFQSLIHQVSVSFRLSQRFMDQRKHYVSIPYSSGQCFFFMAKCAECGEQTFGFNPLFIRSVFLFFPRILQNYRFYVSIPYSSGQCFFYELYFLDNGFIVGFQSLIHQVSVSFRKFMVIKYNGNVPCFNPLFIRSVFLLKINRNSPRRKSKVSIPYSSGQCFF